MTVIWFKNGLTNHFIRHAIDKTILLMTDIWLSNK